MDETRRSWARAGLVAFAVLGTVVLIVAVLALIVTFLWASGALNQNP